MKNADRKMSKGPNFKWVFFFIVRKMSKGPNFKWVFFFIVVFFDKEKRS